MIKIADMLPVLWVASSKRDFLEMPDDIMDEETNYEVTEGNIFAALGRKNPDELLARAELLDKLDFAKLLI